MSPTASKNITFFIFSWSVSSHGSGLYQDLFNETINSDLSVFSFQVQSYKENHEEREIIRLIYVFFELYGYQKSRL